MKKEKLKFKVVVTRIEHLVDFVPIGKLARMTPNFQNQVYGHIRKSVKDEYQKLQNGSTIEVQGYVWSLENTIKEYHPISKKGIIKDN